ncbi:multidrug effflux MFS transporter [Streptomyces sp. NP160]|uniref:Bcr/CflA family efflux MFS transporter n=1 Tax=Streptomyces sp. NP160 TaxID=2586637 RepID=UPI00111A1A61|nr:Bcr/CflA family efflux MFS transporter [Streptomyces sp. NP160]TNM69637.1 multidrug effflux MFS transporter [Streptomyces sp. NP160]
MATTERPDHPDRSTARRPSLLALALVTGIGPFATDTYLAALPQVREALATSSTGAQLTITGFIVGLAVGQLVAGPVSDGRGRRGVVVGSAAAFTVVSLLCVLAPSAALLVLLRVLQGLVAGAGVAVGRAVISDSHDGPAAAKAFGTLAAITLLAPVIAPAIGGLVLQVADWRAVFGLMGALGALMLAAALAGVPETLPPQHRQRGGLRALGARVADLGRDRAFLHPVVVQCLATAGFFVYIGGSSIVLQGALGISSGTYSLVFATNAAAMAATSLAFRLTVVRLGARALRRVGLLTSTAGALALLVTSVVASSGDDGGDPHLGVVWPLLTVVVAGMGFTLPASTVLAQEAGRRSAGTASSLLGGSGFLVGAAVTPLTGLVGDESVLAMAALMVPGFVAATAVALAPDLRRRAVTAP